MRKHGGVNMRLSGARFRPRSSPQCESHRQAQLFAGNLNRAARGDPCPECRSVERLSQFAEDAAAISAARCAAFIAAVAAAFWEIGSGAPAFCIAGFGRALTLRSSAPTAVSIGCDTAGGEASRTTADARPDRNKVHASAAAQTARNSIRLYRAVRL